MIEQSVLFFRSGVDDIYATLLSAADPSGQPAVVVCPSWGFEAYRLRDGCYSLARGVAARGGAALVFDWTGHGDSSGECEDATLDRMTAIAVDALDEAKALRPQASWGFAGIRLGACAAALASGRAEVPMLALLQPSLDVAAHFAEVERAARRATLGRGSRDERWAFGSPLPDHQRWAPADVAGTLRRYTGRMGVVRLARPEMPDLAPGADAVVVPGGWTTGLTGAAKGDLVHLVDAAVGWFCGSDGIR